MATGKHQQMRQPRTVEFEDGNIHPLLGDSVLREIYCDPVSSSGQTRQSQSRWGDLLDIPSGLNTNWITLTSAPAVWLPVISGWYLLVTLLAFVSVLLTLKLHIQSLITALHYMDNTHKQICVMTYTAPRKMKLISLHLRHNYYRLLCTVRSLIVSVVLIKST